MLNKLQLINRKFGSRPLTQTPYDANQEVQNGKNTHDYSTGDLNRMTLKQ